MIILLCLEEAFAVIFYLYYLNTLFSLYLLSDAKRGGGLEGQCNTPIIPVPPVKGEKKTEDKKKIYIYK